MLHRKQRKQIALAGMATGIAMSSIGIGGLIVGNAGAEEPGHSYVSGGDSGVDLISPVSPVAPLEKESTDPTQSAPYTWVPGSETPQATESDPSDPQSAKEFSDHSTAPAPVPGRPTQIPSESRPTSRPSPTSSPSESPSEPSESPSESPSEPSESPSDPSESPSDPGTTEPDPSGTPTD